ncbi:MAG: metallophosphoesterase [Sulfurimonadaceae bacterium]|jgi:serine/threonine protein phosphatase 1|nr:metallophosphoesterase [Sulfurimonadaceae bacterium]
MHYVIGDVHGNYKTLLALIAKLPKDAEIIFVGDLIDRGPQSREVIALIRKHNYKCVMGNHEELMFTYGLGVIKSYQKNIPLDVENFWCIHGGKEALISYGLLKMKKKKAKKIKEFEENLEVFMDDKRWMQQLPDYLELPLQVNGLPVVISHAPIGDAWQYRDDIKKHELFHKTATKNRRNPSEDIEMFNIFGHTPQPFGANQGINFINIDTGCYKEENGYGMLSAYCIESGEVISEENCEDREAVENACII